MADPTTSPNPVSPRAAGVIYLLFFVTAAAGLFFTRSVVVPGDAAGTAAALMSHAGTFRAGFALTLVSNALYLALTALFYRLFGPVNWQVSTVAAFFGVAGCIVQIVAGVFQLGALALPADDVAAKAFGAAQLGAAAVFSLRLYSHAFTIALVLFAVYDLLLGWLVWRSAFVPRWIGALLMLAGAGWLAFLWAPLAAAASAVVLPLGAAAEIVLMLWLLFRAPA
ncbi:MAG TPA: DUF4386 domain-containing protein [Ramlibacter sp.]|jgi:hypothetical protein